MIRYWALILFWCLLSHATTIAQIQKPSPDMNWKKRLKMADEFFEKKDFASAAVFYESVFVEKNSKKETAYYAAEAFFKIRNFPKAAEMYRAIYEKWTSDPLLKLKYARSLKQSGDCKEALTHYETFTNEYRGADYEMLNDLIEKEMLGCKMALNKELEEDQSSYEVSFLSRTVNSDAKEYGLIPFMDDLLYFSSMFEGSSQIYRTERTSAGWDRPIKPNIFGSMEKPHFGHGTFTPDRKTFYFTQCTLNPEKELICEIYYVVRQNSNWLSPVRLPDYINIPNKNTTQPYVTVIDNVEYLFYVSNNEEGIGGMDIWYVQRNAQSDDFNFSLPVNLGIGINTPQDEICPFYDKISETLYFSSNGHPTIGGFDVFKSNGSQTNWDKPVALPIPINSFNDDYYFIFSDNRQEGFFTSNRTQGVDKEYTDNDDIFHFKKKEIEVVIKGNILDKNTNAPVKNVFVELSEIMPTRTSSLVTQIFEDGLYQFPVMPNKKYKIEASKDGYLSAFFEFNTNEFTSSLATVQNIELEPINTTSNLINPENAPVKPVPPNELPLSGRTETVTFNINESEEIENTVEEPIEEVIPGTKPSNTLENEPQEVEPIPSPPPTNYPEPTPTTKDFNALTQDEIRQIIYIDGKPHIRISGNLIEITGLEVTDLTEEIPSFNTTKPDNTEIDFLTTNTKPELGTNYKIQLVAVSKFKDYKFESVKNIGKIQLETFESEGNELVRVMITPFPSLEEARNALTRVNELGFERAYIVRYEDGVRVPGSKIRF